MANNVDTEKSKSQRELTPVQEHYLKKDLLSREIASEISHLSSPTALARFGDPFKPLDSAHPVTPETSEFPFLRFVFVNFVQSFPFLHKDQRPLWQDKFLRLFAEKNISSSLDRSETTKRQKLAKKFERLTLLLLSSGIKTASGREESVRNPEWVEGEDDSRGALSEVSDQQLANLAPEMGVGEMGIDVNVAGVRMVSQRKRIREHQHAEFIVCTKRLGKEDVYVARRYGAFKRLHRELREEFPGKDIPHLPAKNRSSATAPGITETISSAMKGNGDSDDTASITSSESSVSATNETNDTPPSSPTPRVSTPNSKLSSVFHGRSSSSTALEKQAASHKSYVPREKNRLTLRSYLRQILKDKKTARSKALSHFLLKDPLPKLTKEEEADIARRLDMDRLRLAEQKKFVEESRKRARELEKWLRTFKSDLIRNQGLTKLFEEIRVKTSIKDLRPEYQKVAEWAKIEIAAVIYHLFVAEDNSTELFAQARQIHGLMPYSILKNILRFSNPMAMLRGVLDLFLAQPFGQRSLLQRILSVTLNDDIKKIQKNIDDLRAKIGDDALCEKLKNYVEADQEIQDPIRQEAEDGSTELITAILSSEDLKPALDGKQIIRMHAAYLAWVSAVDADEESVQPSDEATLYGRFSQLLKLYARQRDKQQIMSLVFEGVTASLLRDMITILYEPLAKVYKTANVYNSVMDFKEFMDDLIEVVNKANDQDLSTDSNKLVQSFIDLCSRHEDKFYKFVHEVHIHDKDLLFTHLMKWIEVILSFLRNGFSSKVDMNALVFETPGVDTAVALQEIDALIQWNKDRKAWNERRIRAKMASAGDDTMPQGGFSVGDFGLDEDEVLHLQADMSESEDEWDAEDDHKSEISRDDIVEKERKRRAKGRTSVKDETSRRSEPEKPTMVELVKLVPVFVDTLRADMGKVVITEENVDKTDVTKESM